MAVQVQAIHHLHLPRIMSHSPSSHILRSPATFKPLIFRPIRISPLPERQGWRRMPVASVVEESQEKSEPEAEAEEQQPPVAQSELSSELKKAMQERKKDKEGDNFWGGVVEEIREIEWPAFGKVLGTTSVVLGVILGSSVVLLTVNAVLAELSDRVFSGKGLQDFFT